MMYLEHGVGSDWNRRAEIICCMASLCVVKAGESRFIASIQYSEVPEC